jgi:hypothetical protein
MEIDQVLIATARLADGAGELGLASIPGRRDPG